MNWDKLKQKVLYNLSDAEINKIAEERNLSPDIVRKSHEMNQAQTRIAIEKGMRYTAEFLKELAIAYMDAVEEKGAKADKLDEVIGWLTFHLGMFQQSMDAANDMFEDMDGRIAALEKLVLDMDRRLSNIDQIDATVKGDITKLN